MSDMQKITAIVRLNRLEEIERKLSAHGVSGITVSRVKGFGEWHPDAYFGYAPPLDRLVGHVRIEVFVERRHVDKLINVIADAASTGDPGDGVIAVLPVGQFIHIRSHGERERSTSGSPDTEGSPK